MLYMNFSTHSRDYEGSNYFITYLRILRFPVFETVPTTIFFPYKYKSLHSLPMVLVLPQPGGPLIKVSLFSPTFFKA